MKTLILYDSTYGNTKNIAEAIGSTIAGDVNVSHISEVSPAEFKSLNLLIVGSPTQGGRPTQSVLLFLNQNALPATKGTGVAAFDTRLSAKWVKIFGYAAGKIARRLEQLGSTIIISPEGFFVEGTKGPLKEGELERAASWAKELVKRLASTE